MRPYGIPPGRTVSPGTIVGLVCERGGAPMEPPIGVAGAGVVRQAESERVPRRRAWEGIGFVLALALPACATTPPTGYDCAAPPTLSGVVRVKNPIPNRYIVVLKR